MRALIALPILLILVLFALSNPQDVRFGFWPTDYSVQAPLSLAMLVAMAVAFLLGALALWVGGMGTRQRARRAEQARRLLEAQVLELKARLAVPALPPPS